MLGYGEQWVARVNNTLKYDNGVMLDLQRQFVLDWESVEVVMI